MLVLTLLLTTAAAAQEPLCPRALTAAPGAVCAETGHGAVLADTVEEAERLAGYLRTGESRFRDHFAAEIAPYAVTSTSQPLADGALTAAGFTHVLPWPNAAQFEAATRKGIEQATRRFAESQGMSKEQADAMVERAVAQAPTGLTRPALDSAMVPHEMGHLWFTDAFWPEAAAGSPTQRHYGGPGPDWLDEAAAVMMEDEANAATRRTQFKALLRGETVPGVGAADRTMLLDLAGLFARTHPAITQGMTPPPPADMKAGSGGVGVGVVFTPAGANGGGPVNPAGIFYIQARVVSDYLIQASGRTTILADIARAATRGVRVEDWLAQEGVATGLPPTLTALQAGWEVYASGL